MIYMCLHKKTGIIPIHYQLELIPIHTPLKKTRLIHETAKNQQREVVKFVA